MAGPQQPTLIVDAWNVLHVTGVLPPGLAGLDVRGLARLIASSRWRRRWTCLVCDGEAPASPPGANASGFPRIEVRHSGRGREADDEIEAIIAVHSSPSRALIVSADRRVLAAGRRRRASVMASDSFLRALLSDLARRPADPDASGPDTAPDADTAAWMREMGFEPPARPDVSPDPGPADPLLREAMKEWSERLSADDLDMEQWLEDPPEPDPPPP